MIRRARPSLARLPSWGQALVVYLLSRAFTSALFGVLLLVGPALGWPGNRHEVDFASLSGFWDGSQYRQIVEHGYPLDPPQDAAGHLLHSPWAFLPLYPYLVQAVMVTGLGFYPAAAIVSWVAGAAAALLLGALIRRTADAVRARWTVALFCFGPVAFVLQAAYAESLFLVAVFGALLLLARRNYLLVALVLVVAAFTRPGAIALGVPLLLVLITRWRMLRWAQRVSIVVSGAALGAATLAWPAIADAVTGEQSVYLRTETGWGFELVGFRQLEPFTPWFVLSTTFLGVLGAVLVVVILIVVVLFFVRRSSRALGVEVWGFGVGYAVYLVAFFLPQQSTLRILLPLSPMLAERDIAGRPRVRVVLLAVGMVAQVAALWFLWFRSFP